MKKDSKISTINLASSGTKHTNPEEMKKRLEKLRKEDA
jgi:hypothetical protein